MVALRKYFDNSGRPIELGAQLRVGGEGTVFELPQHPQYVAKLYHKSVVSPEKAAKLTWMVATQNSALMQIAAWPAATLHDRPGGSICGFAMPRINGYKEAHLLYGPQSRRREFPSADWQYLIHVAMNCAAAFDSIHGSGSLIADVNAGNVLVSPRDATIRLIDCDSFQVNANGTTLLCDVGVPEYTPPELQGQAFRNVARTENHDRFGLAVLIFHLMFMGRHPFFGRFLGAGDMPLDRAIREFRFAFGSSASGKQMAPPPHSLPFAALSPAITQLFERAFADRSAVQGRPNASEWRDTLKGFLLQIVNCSADSSHKYGNFMSRCPWCEIMASGGPAFFINLQSGVVDFICSPNDLDQLVARARSMAALPSASSVALVQAPPAARPLPPAAISARRNLRKVSWLMTGGGAVAALGLLFALALSSTVAIIVLCGGLAVALCGACLGWYLRRFSSFGVEVHRRRIVAQQARRHANQLESELRGIGAHISGDAAAAMRQLENVRAEYSGLRHAFEGELAVQVRDKESAQRRLFLQSVLIVDHEIDGIGAGRKAKLLSFNVETAFDVLYGNLDDVPGFGPKLRESLNRWACLVDAGFRFDPSRDLPEADRRAVVMKFIQRQLQLRAHAERTVTELANSYQQTEARQRQLAQAVQNARLEAAGAETDLLVV